MKKLAAALLLLPALFAGSLQAQNRSVQFEDTTFAISLAKAKAANKPIFMDGFTSWCGPCKYMAKKVFTQDKVADFMNANFVSVKFDMEKGEGVTLAKKYGVNVYPTFLILDTAGNLVHRIVGSSEADEFLEKVKAGLNPATSLAAQQATYRAGDRTPAFVKGYLNTLKEAYMEDTAKVVATAYLRSLKEKDRITKDSWNIYNDFINNASSKEFLFILTNRIKFTDAVGDSAVDAKITSVFTDKAMSFLINRKGAVYSKEESQKFRNLVNASKPSNIQKYFLILDLADAKFAKNSGTIAAIVDGSMKKVELTDEECHVILFQIIPLVADSKNKSAIATINAYIDTRIASIKEEWTKPYFEKLKNKLNGTTEEAKK
ncbi:thioredoxin fold domain-containing protein [uncultured Acetobacteroides sp.]|uniref:thioredoxin family protein n=1 Tax=uncultured Acetobacteroides sp. TaxID=1760811 RepID=UPI0029F571B5|nr:thioredoxin fold domain-containing protein [uncultured Acetobacteroides sp.]